MFRVKSFVICKLGFSVERRKGMMSAEKILSASLCGLTWIVWTLISKTQNRRKKCISSHPNAESERLSYFIPGIGADRRGQLVPQLDQDQGSPCSDFGSTPHTVSTRASKEGSWVPVWDPGTTDGCARQESMGVCQGSGGHHEDMVSIPRRTWTTEDCFSLLFHAPGWPVLVAGAWANPH